MITPADVAHHLALPDSEVESVTLETVTAAVNAKVAAWHGYDDAAEFTPPHTAGAIMLAAHLYRRRNTPGGIEQFNELGVAYVQRSDPHVSMLLGLGGWEHPKVG